MQNCGCVDERNEDDAHDVEVYTRMCIYYIYDGVKWSGYGEHALTIFVAGRREFDKGIDFNLKQIILSTTR